MLNCTPQIGISISKTWPKTTKKLNILRSLFCFTMSSIIHIFGGLVFKSFIWLSPFPFHSMALHMTLKWFRLCLGYRLWLSLLTIALLAREHWFWEVNSRRINMRNKAISLVVRLRKIYEWMFDKNLFRKFLIEPA